MHTAKRIAAMIRANVDAMYTGKITYDQFTVVQRATWELAERGDKLIGFNAASRRVMIVNRELNK